MWVPAVAGTPLARGGGPRESYWRGVGAPASPTLVVTGGPHPALNGVAATAATRLSCHKRATLTLGPRGPSQCPGPALAGPGRPPGMAGQGPRVL